MLSRLFRSPRSADAGAVTKTDRTDRTDKTTVRRRREAASDGASDSTTTKPPSSSSGTGTGTDLGAALAHAAETRGLKAHKTIPEFKRAAAAAAAGGEGAPIKITFGCHAEQSPLHEMQDATTVTHVAVEGCGQVSVFGVYDGHGPTSECVAFVADELPAMVASASSRLSSSASDVRQWTDVLQDAFTACGDKWIASHPRNPRSGCVASVAIVAGLDVVLANVGDCRVVVSDPDHPDGVVQVTRDHRASDPDEQARIVGAGGFVRNDRVMNVLSPSRAFGDTDLRTSPDGSVNEIVTHRPDTYHVRVKLDVAGEAVMILASDGVWDRVDAADAYRVVRSVLDDDPDALDVAAKALVESARIDDNNDDISVQVVVWRTCVV